MAHILIVDGDPSLRRMLAEIVSLEGHTYTCATDGLEALAVIRPSLHPLVVVTNLRMERMNGWDALRIVAADPDLASLHSYIVMSAVSNLERYRSVWERMPGFVGELLMPFTSLQLLDLVEPAIARIAERNP